MKTAPKVSLAPFTSFGVGGPAEKLITIESSDELAEAVSQANEPIWCLGYGTNVLISDNGLPGTTLLFRNKSIEQTGETLIVDAGVWWDDLVQYALSNNLWGIEFTSMVPGGVGAAVFINITAYGQSVSDTIEWVEVFDTKQNKLRKIAKDEMSWDYKKSIFQAPQNSHLIIVRAAFRLSSSPTGNLEYKSALKVAEELALEPNTLESRRAIIIEDRKRKGSIFMPNQGYEKTVGSFFRNPVVTEQQLEKVASADESGGSLADWKQINKVHGGRSDRMSAAIVLLAAGYKRGQTWGPVRLHPKHVLKIENTGGATAQQIFDVSQEIIRTVQDKLGITPEPEARILGKFS